MKVVQWAKSGIWHAVTNERMRLTHCGRTWPNDEEVKLGEVRMRATIPNRCGRCFD